MRVYLDKEESCGGIEGGDSPLESGKVEKMGNITGRGTWVRVRER